MSAYFSGKEVSLKESCLTWADALDFCTGLSTGLVDSGARLLQKRNITKLLPPVVRVKLCNLPICLG